MPFQSLFTTEKLMSIAWALLLTYVIMLIPSDAWAAASATGTIGGVKFGIGTGGAGGGAGGEPTGITGVLCTVVGWFTGTIGKAIATLAIIVVGIGALMGKVSWGMAIIVGLGVGVVFGASNIVDVLGGTGSC